MQDPRLLGKDATKTATVAQLTLYETKLVETFIDDAIMVTAAGPTIPEALLEQLADSGKMVLPVGGRDTQELIVVGKSNGEIEKKTIEYVRFVRLIGEQGW